MQEVSILPHKKNWFNVSIFGILLREHGFCDFVAYTFFGPVHDFDDQMKIHEGRGGHTFTVSRKDGRASRVLLLHSTMRFHQNHRHHPCHHHHVNINSFLHKTVAS